MDADRPRLLIGGAVYRVMEILSAGPTTVEQLKAAGLSESSIYKARCCLVERGWGGVGLMLTDSGRFALRASLGLPDNQPADPDQIRQIVRPMEGVRWP